MSRLTDGPDGTGTANGGHGGGPAWASPKRFGQHFLAPAWADKVIEAVSPQPDDRFLEIGPGPGALTTRLARRVRHLTAVEVDRDFAAELAAGAPPHVTIVTADFLALDLAASLRAGTAPRRRQRSLQHFLADSFQAARRGTQRRQGS